MASMRCGYMYNHLFSTHKDSAILVEAMGRVNAICDMRIRYGPRECDMRYAKTPWAARMRYAIREDAKGRANAICDTRIGYARYANALWAA